MGMIAWRRRVVIQKKAEKYAAENPGTPVPGTGVFRKRRKCRCESCGPKRYRRPRKGGGEKSP